MLVVISNLPLQSDAMTYISPLNTNGIIMYVLYSIKRKNLFHMDQNTGTPALMVCIKGNN